MLHGATLALRWGPEAGQTLVRRTDGGHVAAGAVRVRRRRRAPGVDAVGTSRRPPVDGTWVWELRSIDAEGDERVEREEWHLAESPDGISGYYDRTVARVRGDGTNSRATAMPRYETDDPLQRRRPALRRQGHANRDRLQGAAAARCDNALRRLDTYQGHVADADSLVLSWGPGNQLLRRKK